MKFLFVVPVILLSLLSIPGCGSGSGTTVNPAPTMTEEELVEMDKESEKARQEAIRDGM